MQTKAYLIRVIGIVQSVGFRPFIFKLFCRYTGWVKNDSNGVLIYLESSLSKDEVEKLIKDNKPENAKIESISINTFHIKKRAFGKFFIKETQKNRGNLVVPPDLSICENCQKELLDKKNRRYLHPFINCTDCGPRFSIIQETPYDRNKTTMKQFKMCKECKNEFENPLNRRFHAQPTACNLCGPEYFLIENKKLKKRGIEAIKEASIRLLKGEVALIKGIGGYHLVCDALNNRAVEKIKELKNRQNKPFAVIAKDLAIVEQRCIIGKLEKELLTNSQKPIVLLQTKYENILKNIRNKSPYLGVMLPYAPIHLLLFYFSDMEFIVATSANTTEKPLIYKDIDAVNFEGADFVLTNNRKIVRPIEDSIVKVIDEKSVIYRYGRGFAPGLFLKKTKPSILALGGDLKNNIALSFDNKIVLSQYTGDLEEYENYLRFDEKVQDFLQFFNTKPDIVVCDKHPNYISTNYALENFENIYQVQHHKAHFASVLFEHNLDEDAVGVVMDGTGFGDDGEIWGGEFFIHSNSKIEHIGRIEYMPFAFADRAVKEPYKLAVLWLTAFGIEKHPLFDEYKTTSNMAKKARRSKTSSAGRLFDAASVLLDISKTSTYEAEAAINLTYEAHKAQTDRYFPYEIKNFNIDFSKTIKEMAHLYKTDKKPLYAKMFHNTFIKALTENILNISKSTGIKTIALSGGVFQNSIILKGVIEELLKMNIKVFFNEKAPINDGGIALGQIFIFDKIHN